MIASIENAIELIKHGAKLDTKDKNGKTALMNTTERDVFLLLIERGADVNVDIDGESVLTNLVESYNDISERLKTISKNSEVKMTERLRAALDKNSTFKKLNFKLWVQTNT